MSDDAKKPPKRTDVGHGRPPAEHQFQKGVSGNPKGRPPKKKSREGYDGIFLDMIAVVKDGKRGELTGLEVHLQKNLKKAVDPNFKGSLKKVRYLLGVFSTYGVKDEQTEESLPGGVVRPRQFSMMPPRMEEILNATGAASCSADIRKAREAYLAELAPEERVRAVEERGEYAALEPGSEGCVAAYHAEVYRLTLVAASASSPKVDPVRSIIQAFASEMQTIRQGGKEDRLSTYALLLRLLQKDFLEGDGVTIHLVNKLSGKTTAGGKPKLEPQGVMVAPPELPLSQLSYVTEMHNLYHERPPTLESILQPALLEVERLKAKQQGRPLPADHAEKVKYWEDYHRPSLEAQARINELERNPPDAFPEYRHLRPEGWIPPPQSETFRMFFDDSPISAHRGGEAVAPAARVTDGGSVLSKLEALRTEREEIVRAFEVEVQALAKLDLETRQRKSHDYNQRRRAALAAIDREISHVESQRSLADIVRAAGERVQRMQDSDASKPSPPGGRNTTYR